MFDIESLEGRRHLSATVPAAFQDAAGIVYVQGTGGADQITVGEVAIGTPIGENNTPTGPGTVGVLIFYGDGNALTFQKDFFNVKAVVIDAGDGNDAVTSYSYTVPNIIFGGAGDDTISMTDDNSEVAPGDTPTATSLIFGNGGNDNISLTGANNDIAAGNDGNDVLNVISGSATLLGGNGDDFFAVTNINWDVFNPSTSPVTVALADGGNGNDTLFSTLGTQVTFLGGNGNDTLDYFGGAVAFYGGNGNDTADIYATFPGLDVTNAGLTYNGGNGSDTLNTDSSATSADTTTTSVETSTVETLPPPTV